MQSGKDGACHERPCCIKLTNSKDSPKLTLYSKSCGIRVLNVMFKLSQHSARQQDMITSSHAFQCSIRQESRATRAWPRTVSVGQTLNVLVTGVIDARKVILLSIRYDLAQSGGESRV